MGCSPFSSCIFKCFKPFGFRRFLCFYLRDRASACASINQALRTSETPPTCKNRAKISRRLLLSKTRRAKAPWSAEYPCKVPGFRHGTLRAIKCAKCRDVHGPTVTKTGPTSIGRQDEPPCLISAVAAIPTDIRSIYRCTADRPSESLGGRRSTCVVRRRGRTARNQ